MDELRDIKRKEKDLGWARIFTMPSEKLLNELYSSRHNSLYDYLRERLEGKYRSNPLVPKFPDFKLLTAPRIKVLEFRYKGYSEYEVQMLTYNPEQFELLYGGAID